MTKIFETPLTETDNVLTVIVYAEGGESRTRPKEIGKDFRRTEEDSQKTQICSDVT